MAGYGADGVGLVVHFADGGDFRCGAGEEDFERVGHVRCLTCRGGFCEGVFCSTRWLARNQAEGAEPASVRPADWRFCSLYAPQI